MADFHPNHIGFMQVFCKNCQYVIEYPRHYSNHIGALGISQEKSECRHPENTKYTVRTTPYEQTYEKHHRLCSDANKDNKCPHFKVKIRKKSFFEKIKEIF